MTTIRTITLAVLSLLATLPAARAVPNVFLGGGNVIPVIPAQPRFNGNLTRDVLAMENWEKREFPGPWKKEPALDGEFEKRMTAMPVLFGAVPDSVAAYGDDANGLREIAITYLDAGTFFGYQYGGETTHAKREAGTERRSEFRQRFNEHSRELKRILEAGCGPGQMKILGRSDLLRRSYTDYRWGGFILRLATRADHSIALMLMREDRPVDSLVDAEFVALRSNERAERLASNVLRDSPRGDLLVEDIPMFTQGDTPFCGIHSLAMVGHYYGLRMRADALAAAAGFRNTGSARGSNVLELYHATAEEVAMDTSTSSRFDLRRVAKAIEEGRPVIVWRRVSLEREKVHDRNAKMLAGNPRAELPKLNKSQLAALPKKEKKGTPSHASVISGVNLERGEVVFTEPWGEHARWRRMTEEEMKATTYAVFYFEF